MSVEQSSPLVSSKAVASADSRGGVGKAKAATNQGAGDSAPGGFMALLAAFDEPESLASLPVDVAPELPSGLAAPTTTLAQADMVDVPRSELSMLLGQKPPLNAQAQVDDVVTESPVGLVAPTTTLAQTDVVDVPRSELSMLLGQKIPLGTQAQVDDVTTGPSVGLVAPTTIPDKTEAVDIPWSELSMLLSQKIPQSEQVPVNGQSDSDSSSLAAPYQLLGKPLALPDPKVSDFSRAASTTIKATVESPVPDMANQVQSVPGRKTSAAQSLQSANNVAESQVLKPTTFLDLVAKEPMLPGALLTSGLGADVLSLATRGVNKPISGLVATGLEGAFSQHALGASGSAGVPSAAVGAILSPEAAVAEQVTYWVSQGIQNAQLKLEGFGSEPVEVSIRLKGQEAQIDFRTDQPEVRQMLEGALTQLKETLAKEGLVLAGVSVGTSGQEGAGAQDRRQRPNARQTTVATREVGPTVAMQRAGPAAGRALDVFV